MERERHDREIPHHETAGRPARAGAAVLLFLALATTSCSGDDDSDSGSPEPQSTASGSAFDIKTEATVEQVAGRLSRPERKQLARSVTKVAQQWFNAAYVGGDYPRSDFRDAFPGFTRGARADAERDKDLMTNGRSAPRSTVSPRPAACSGSTSCRPNKRAVAATARFRLGFRTEGDLVRDVHGPGPAAAHPAGRVGLEDLRLPRRQVEQGMRGPDMTHPNNAEQPRKRGRLLRALVLAGVLATAALVVPNSSVQPSDVELVKLRTAEGVDAGRAT